MASRCFLTRTTPVPQVPAPAQVERHGTVVDPGRVDAFIASSTTSGPMPSPPMIPIR